MSAGEGWIKTQLGEVATLVKGISYASEDYCGAGEGAVFITIKCVSKAGGFKREGIKYFKGSIAPSQVLQPGELLIANTDLTRAGDIVGCPMVVPIMSGEIITMSMDLSKVVEDDAKIDRDFLYYKLMTDSVRSFMKDHASGSTVLHLQTRAVPDLELEIPTSKPEQTKIVEVLSTVDRAIEQTEALIAKQQHIKTGLMQDLLTRGIDEYGNLRSEQTHEFKDSPLGRIPMEWEVKYLMEIVAITEGQRDPKQEHYRDWLLVAPDHIESKSGFLLTKKTAREQGAISGKYEFSCGDVVYSKIRPYLRKAILVDFNGLCSADMYPLRPKEGVRSEFVLMTILGERFSRYAESVSERSGFPKINRKELSEFQVALASEPEQNRMATLTKELSTLSMQDKKHFSKLRSLKTALMQDLLTGKKRVTALLNNTEVAST